MWQPPPGTGTELSTVLTAGKATWGSRGPTLAWGRQPSGTLKRPGPARVTRSHQPHGQETGTQATPGPWALQVPVWATHTQTVSLPLPALQQRGTYQGQGLPPKESKAGILVPRLPIPADQAHPLRSRSSAPGQAPRPAL